MNTPLCAFASGKATRNLAATVDSTMDLPLAPPFDGWDAFTQSWIAAPCAVTAAASAHGHARQTAPQLTPPAVHASTPHAPEPLGAPQAVASQVHTCHQSPTAHVHEISVVATLQEAPEAMTPEGVPVTPEALEASSIALAWKLQQEEQAAFYQAISANTPAAISPGARAAAATPEQPAQMASLASASPEDASLQLALRLQQVSSLSPAPSCACLRHRMRLTLHAVRLAGGTAMAADAVTAVVSRGDGRH